MGRRSAEPGKCDREGAPGPVSLPTCRGATLHGPHPLALRHYSEDYRSPMLGSLAGILFDGFAYECCCSCCPSPFGHAGDDELHQPGALRVRHVRAAIIAVTLIDSFGWPFLATLPAAFVAAAALSAVLERAPVSQGLPVRATSTSACSRSGVVFMSVAAGAYIWGTVGSVPCRLPAFLTGRSMAMASFSAAYRIFPRGDRARRSTVILIAGLEWTRFGAQSARGRNQRMARAWARRGPTRF